MKDKIGRYVAYLRKFANSPDKDAVIKDILSEMKDKGPLNGVRSYLHKKAYATGSVAGFDWEYNETSPLIVEDYDMSTATILPYSASPKFSIIIPVYNQLSLTASCINSVYKSTDRTDYEIIIADDNSPEDTSVLKTCFGHLIIHRNDTNKGFLLNCNLAAKKARGEYIVLLNNDTQVQPGWLDELLAVFEEHERVGIVGSKLYYPDGSLQEAGGIMWQDATAWNYGNGDKPAKPEYSYVHEVDYVSGASFMIPTALWQELGGFDERYVPAYCEDSDMCFAVRDKGYKVMFQPFSKVVHFEGVSHGKNESKGIKKYQVANRRKFYDKWKKELQLKSKNGENVETEKDRTTGKRHVLVVDHYLPEVDKDAGSRTISNYMAVLQELGYAVKFLGENDNSVPKYRKIYQEKGVEVLYGSQFYFLQRNWKKYLLENMHKLDAILLSRSSVCSPMLSFLRENKITYKGNIIYYGHDLGFLRVEQEAKAKKDDSLHKLYKYLKAKEDFMYNTADNSLVCSLQELEYLRGYIHKPLHYVPPYFFKVSEDGLSYTEREGLLFVGGFNHPPNQDAMKWFIDQVYPPLAKEGIKLTVAGSKMPAFMYDYQKKYSTIIVKADVPSDELEELYRTTRVVIVPLLSGAGVKGKVIEAMAKGVAIVGTDIAFEGMPKDVDFIYKGANSAAETAAEIRRAYNEPAYWTQLAEFGKSYVRSNFDKENMKQVFRKIIEGR